MALSLSPHKQQVGDTSVVSNSPLLSYSTPRQFTTTVVHDNSNLETLSMSKTRSPLLTPNFKNVTQEDVGRGKVVSSTQLLAAGSDLPSWTPLKTQTRERDDKLLVSDSESETDELAIGWGAPGSATKRLRDPPTNVQTVTVKSPVATEQSLKPSPTSTRGSGSGVKTARFDGVIITTKPPLYKKNSPRGKPGPAPRSNARVSTSLVDALARTFDANRYIEGPSSRQLRQHDSDLPTVPQTDAETTTDAEEDRFQLNTRLAPSPLKRRLPRRLGRVAASANVSETNSEDATPPTLQQLGLVPQPERPVKRPRAIQYESNSVLIDTALGTVQAPIGWDAELDFITREEDFITSPAQTTAPSISADMRMSVESDRAPGKMAIPSTVGGGWRMATRGEPTRAVLSPYLSHGAKFKQRLDAIFGQNATVRTDRAARPRSVEYDFYAPFRDLDRAPSPGTSDSIVSVNFTSTAEEGASAIPSTRITSQSPNIPSSDISTDRLPRSPPNEVALVREPVNEEQMVGWIAALQRLIKGKVHVKEEDLETLSIILAEIESVKDSLGNIAMTSELHQSIKRLAELPGIPFGDRNKLRERAKHTFQTWPLMMVPGAS